MEKYTSILALGVLILCLAYLVSSALKAKTKVPEEFANMPTASQTSMISADVPGATSSNPANSVAQPKDIQALMDSATTLNQLIATNDPNNLQLDKAVLDQVQAFQTSYSNLSTSLRVAFAMPNSPNAPPASFVSAQSAMINTLIGQIRSAPTKAAVAAAAVGGVAQGTDKPYTRIGCFTDQQDRAVPTNEDVNDPDLPGDYHTRQNAIDQCYKVALRKSHKIFAIQAGGWCASSPSDDPATYAKYGISQGCKSDGKGGHWANDIYKITPKPLDIPPTTVAGVPGEITLKQLHNLHDRIQAEIIRLANLRSSSPTLTNRISLLEKLSADIGDIITSIERGIMKLEDVPIKADQAEIFLAGLSNIDVALPGLFMPSGKTPDTVQAPPSAPADVLGNPAVQSLLQNAQYLKWNVQLNLEFNPELAQKSKLLDRLQEMEKRLTALSISETPLPKDMYDLYKREMKTIQVIMNGGSQTKAPPTDIPKSQSSRLSLPFSTADYPSSAQMASAQGQDARAYTNPDINIRPGFMMNDDTIARRASASAFDASTVGGPDFKKRSMDLCRQINSAELGNPASFGCIENPDAVGQTYSWKGNYEMVCNRIGDTWGGWYPEMFGCPKYDPTAKFNASMM